jgi:hypothetical protein
MAERKRLRTLLCPHQYIDNVPYNHDLNDDGAMENNVGEGLVEDIVDTQTTKMDVLARPT